MVDELVIESIKLSIGKGIVFWDLANRRYEGKVLAVSDNFLKYYDSRKCCERFVKLTEIKEAEIK